MKRMKYQSILTPCAPAVCFPLSTGREGGRQLAGVGVSQEKTRTETKKLKK